MWTFRGCQGAERVKRMCGRYTLTTTEGDLAEAFSLEALPHVEPRYNIAPTQDGSVVRILGGGGPRELHQLRWGLIPSWARDPSLGNRMINARSESVETKPAFRAAFRRRRCLVPSDGFYEWRRDGKRKQPFCIRRQDQRPFAFAGLWEHWEGPDGRLIDSFAILTTEPNDVLRPLHDRMPVILAPHSYDLWLDPKMEDTETLKRLLKPSPSCELAAYPVSTRVNNPVHDDRSCLTRIKGSDGFDQPLEYR